MRCALPGFRNRLYRFFLLLLPGLPLAGAAAQGRGARVLDSLDNLYLSATRAGQVIVVDQGARKAIFDTGGKPVTAFIHDELWKGLDGHLVARMGGWYFLLDAQGNIIRAFGGKVSGVDTVQRQYFNRENNVTIRYDPGANEVERTYVNEQEFRTGLYRWSDENNNLYGVKDTFSRIILPREYDGQISIGASGIVAIKKDTAFAYDRLGRLRFRCRADDCRMLPHGLAAIQLYGLWALKDSSGAPVTPFRYSKIEDPTNDNFIQADNSILDYAGKEMISGQYSHVYTHPGGWVELNDPGFSGTEIRDEHFNIIFKANKFGRRDYIGTRFIHLYKDYNDRAPLIYDLSSRKISGYQVESSLTDDAYVIYAGKTYGRQILKGDTVLKLPRFTEVEVEHSREFLPFFKIADEGAGGRGFLEERSRNEYDGFRAIPRKQRNARLGLLDSNMRLIVPLTASAIQVLGRDLIYAYQPQDSSGYLYSGSGKLLHKIQGAAEARRWQMFVRIRSINTATLMDTLGHIFYQGAEQPSLLYPDARQENQPQFPSLLLYDDQSGYSGLYDLKGRQLLPHQYYAVAQKVPGLFSLKKGDSIYFVNTKGRLLFGGRGFAGRKYHLLEGYGVLIQDGQHKWGVLGADGQPVLPFIYDTLGLLQAPNMPVQYVVGQNGQYSMIDNAGRLRYPLQSWKPLRWRTDNYYQAENHQYYQIRNGQAMQVTPETYAAFNAGQRNEGRAIFRKIGNGEDIPSGIYNRSMKRIAPWYPGFDYRDLWDKIVTTDSARQHIAVMDSAGNVLVPLIVNPDALIINNSIITAIYRNGHDLLFNGNGNQHEIKVDSTTRGYVLQYPGSMNVTNSATFTFTRSGGKKGIISNTGELLQDDQVQQIYQADYAWRIRRAGRWGLLNPTTLRYIHPADADSISYNRQTHDFFIFKSGLVGLYHGERRIYIPPVYMRIYNPSTLQNGFIIVRAKEGFTMLDKSGRRVSAFLDSISANANSLLDIPAFMNREEVSLSVNDEGGIVVNQGLDAKVKRMGISGYYYHMVVVQVGDKQGLYSNETFRLVLPAAYDAIEDANRQHGFIAWKYKADKHQGMDSTLLLDAKGKLIYAIKGGCSPKEKDGYWYVRGEGKSPVFSMDGKMIVPDGYEVSEIIRNSFFIVKKAGLSGIINDTGKWTIPLSLDKIENDSRDGSDFLIGEKYGESDDKYCLISPAGYALTKPVYDEIRLTASGVLFKRGRTYGYLDATGKETIRKWPADEMED